MRIDSGDLAAHAQAVRALLDAGGLREARVFASGNLDEWRIAELLAAGAPIDGFGVGTALDTSADAPWLDAVYKLQAYAGRPRRKRSEGKVTWPGAKQVFRRFDDAGLLASDTVARLDEQLPGAPLLAPCMRTGRRLGPSPSLAQARARCAAEQQALPARRCTPEAAALPYPVAISEGLRSLAREVDAATTSPVPPVAPVAPVAPVPPES